MLPNDDTTFPAPVVILPPIESIGPAAAANATPFIIICCISGDNLPNCSAAPDTKFENSVIAGATAGSTVWPICIPAIFTSLRALAKFSADVLSILSNAVCSVPAEFCIDVIAPLKSSACCINVAAPFPASCELNTSAMDIPVSSQCCCTIPSTSVRLLPSSINSLKDFPVFSLSMSDTVLPPLPNSLSIELIYVVDSAVAIPFLVVVTYADVILSRLTPNIFAVGITLPIDEPNSLTVVLPKFCVCMSLLAISSAVPAELPYAFMTVVRTSTDVAASVNPAFASFVDSVTKATASPVDCPADIAEYTLSAISDAATPVSLDRSRIALCKSSIGTCDVSAMVLTFAIDVSKSEASLAVAVPIPIIGVVTVFVRVFPTDVIFFPAFCIPSPALSTVDLKFFAFSCICWNVLDALSFAVMSTLNV